ncbi:MAG: bacillithiol biosynthesis cysteine-adding enzyme BshC [Terriglobia bacterium]
MQCTCVRQTDLPNTSKLFSDLIYRFDRVSDLYPFPPNDLGALERAARFDFPDDRRAATVRALTPLNQGNPSLARLAEPGTVAIVTGQQVGLFGGPAYTIYKALTAIRIAEELSERGIPAVPVFWLATEDHDFVEINHTWVFGPDHQPVRLAVRQPATGGARPVGGVTPQDLPIAELRSALAGFPFADEAVALVERAYQPGRDMGSSFAHLIRELFAPWGLLLIDPMTPALREIAAPLMRQAVERMPELNAALMERAKELEARGYHAQVLVDNKTSLVFLLENGQRLSPRQAKASPADLAARAHQLSPNALLRPVVQDYLLPTAAYAGGAAELAYFAQSQVLYEKLLGRQPVAFPRAGFTLLDQRAGKQMARYRLNPTDLFVNDQTLREKVAQRLVPPGLKGELDRAGDTVARTLNELSEGLRAFDVNLVSALETSRRKIEYQLGKIAHKTAAQMLLKNEQAQRDARSLHGLVFPEGHLQERLYSIVPFLAKFGPDLIGDVYQQVRVECPDHQFAII